MLIAGMHYSDPNAVSQLTEGLNRVFMVSKKEPLFLCIGSDRHLLDCFAPLVGTMLTAQVPEINLFGTLDNPLHARNLARELQTIKKVHPDKLQVAIDASLGAEQDLGYVKLRDESLQPGKALAKHLPPVGQISIIGIVGTRIDRYTALSVNNGSLAHVYHMAQVVTQAVVRWFAQR